MILLLTMAGKYERFRNFSYEIPKYLLPLSNRNILYYVLESFNIPENFDTVLLVVNKRDIRFKSQINSILREFDCDNKDLIFIEDTPGQSVTAIKGFEHLMDNGIEDFITINNIYTIFLNRNFTQVKNKLKECDCVVDTFYSNNEHYSYVLSDGENVKMIVEKNKISDEASSGCYSFNSISNTIEYLKKSENLYISDSIKTMIEDSKDVKLVRYMRENDTFVLGTPEQYINSMTYFDLLIRNKK